MPRKRVSIYVEKHELYQSWRWMVRRYKIDNMVCERWLSFYNFIEDIKIHPGKKEYYFLRKDLTKPHNIDNYEWKKVSTSYETKEKKRLYMEKWYARKRAENPEYDFNYSLKKVYKMGAGDYNKILEKQNGVCAICKEKEKSIAPTTNKVRRLNVDHCHVTGKMRGLLCSRCNRGLGFFRDNVDNLKKAIEYLNINNN